MVSHDKHHRYTCILGRRIRIFNRNFPQVGNKSFDYEVAFHLSDSLLKPLVSPKLSEAKQQRSLYFVPLVMTMAVVASLVAQWITCLTHTRESIPFGSIPLYGSDFFRPYFTSDRCHLRHVNLIRGFGYSEKAINVCCRSVSPPLQGNGKPAGGNLLRTASLLSRSEPALNCRSHIAVSTRNTQTSYMQRGRLCSKTSTAPQKKMAVVTL